VKHEHSGSEYRDRVAECAAAVEALGVESLRDVTPTQLEANAVCLSPVLLRRARHVVTENDRVNRFVDASLRGESQVMGRLMVESHRSMQHDYEVSCAELDFLVDRALEIEGVIGSRMTGGGFGGCTVTMLRPAALPHFNEAIVQAYEREYKITPEIYPCVPSEGAGELKNLETIPGPA
jgi:galactokinase